MNYSTTQASNLVSFIGLLGVILSHFHINITNEELQTVVSSVIILGGILLNWFHRYQKGDLTVGGTRKV